MAGRKRGFRVDVSKLETLTGKMLMTWAELSRASGVSPTVITTVRKGRGATGNTVRKLAATLHVEPLELIKK